MAEEGRGRAAQRGDAGHRGEGEGRRGMNAMSFFLFFCMSNFFLGQPAENTPDPNGRSLI
jgi:hypothetical protein